MRPGPQEHVSDILPVTILEGGHSVQWALAQLQSGNKVRRMVWPDDLYTHMFHGKITKSDSYAVGRTPERFLKVYIHTNDWVIY